MKKAIAFLILLINLFAFRPMYAFTGTYVVKQKDIFKGYAVEKIWLSEYAVPQVVLSGVVYTPDAALPKDAKLSDPNKIQVQIGMERKRPFAVVRVPLYTAGADAGQVNMVSQFTLTVNEQPKAANRNAARTTDVYTSVLSTGTWYKIAITQTGYYLLDNSFFNSMGLPAGTTRANIRIFGNGGNMLSEDNSVSRPTDLIENAISVNGDLNNAGNVIFYAVGPTSWVFDSVNQMFVHQKNIYSDTAYYFINFDQSGGGKHITSQPAVAAANVTVSSFNYYDVHDVDLENPAELGKEWYGEEFYPQLGNTTQQFSFNIGATVSNVYLQTVMGSTADVGGCSYTVSVNGNSLGTGPFLSCTGCPDNPDNVMNQDTVYGSVACNSSVATVSITFNAADASGVGYLDYIELNARRGLSMNSDQMSFRDWQSVGAGNIAAYQLQGANSNTQVWDITDRQNPVLMNGSLSGSTYTFSQDAAILHEYAAMNSSNLFTPSYIGTVANQNLHDSGQVDLIIVTYPDFLDQANQLATYHRQHDNMRVAVATTAQVYNEFSSGAQDLSAIRDYARMYYKRAGTDASQMPKYILLFGGASYDYKNRLANNSNYVPVYESDSAFNDLIAFSSDDFYGFLDDNENIENPNIINALDIGIGRLPARSEDDATSLVNKIMGYNQPATLGPWRVSATFAADMGCVGAPDQIDAAGNHMYDAETASNQLTVSGANLYNIEKVYVDAIPIVSTPAGNRCPNANAIIDQQVFNGTFLINYNGHGNPDVWSGERILTENDFNNWNNTNMLPLMVTATCDFGQFDHPQFVSSAEQMVIRSGGGVIAILTTTEAVYSTFNIELNTQFLAAQFTRNANLSWNTFGDAFRIGKNATYLYTDDPSTTVNFRKFALLGDPALTPDFPNYNIKLDSVRDGATQLPSDTIKALGAYVAYGSIRDYDGSVLTTFNGQLSVSFYDKPRAITTISGCNETFYLQDNLVYKGKATVVNGQYSFTFITPKDIDYYLGTGKISMYADNGITDAAGVDTSLTVGGFSDNPVVSSDTPVVKPYINDSLFLNDGITGANTSLFVALYDSTGINVSGNEVGHDLIGVLDGNLEAPYILNDYYQTAPNTYQRGYVTFPISGLAYGKHSLKVKAWDVNDNVGTGTVEFIVVDSTVVDIQQLGNYPNPFSSSTNFVFEQNHPFDQLDAQIEIYNVAGALVRNINESFTATDSRTNVITWDGTDNHGALLPSGVYVYRLNLTTGNGFRSSAYQKLVIVR